MSSIVQFVFESLTGVLWGAGKTLLKSAWSRGGNPYEYALAYVDHYSNRRSPYQIAEQVEGYSEAVKFLKECGRGGGNAKDPRYRCSNTNSSLEARVAYMNTALDNNVHL